MQPQIAVSLALVGTATIVGSYMLAYSLRTDSLAYSENPQPIVMELFTSQNCEQCPAADELLIKTAEKMPAVVALSCHVDYWDDNRWRDTLELKACIERQRSYIAADGSSNVFAPELRINGAISVNGASETDISHVVKDEENQVIELKIKQNPDGGFETQLPQDLPVSEAYFMAYKKAHTEDIRGGVNAGKQVTYYHAVSTILQVPVTKGTLEIPSLPKDQDGFALFLHQHVTKGLGRVIAAGEWNR